MELGYGARGGSSTYTVQNLETGGISLNSFEFTPAQEVISTQTHVHEIQGSTTIFTDIPHNHRFAGLTGQLIPIANNDHIHAFEVSTDFTEIHLHGMGGFTGPSIPVGNGRHIHFASGITTLNRGHIHEFFFATLIDDPLRR